MEMSAWDEFEQRLSCEASWYADSSPLAWPLTDELVQRLIERNSAALATLAALDERRTDTSEDDTPVMQELSRLDAKLTALVDIVNRLVTPDSHLPPRRPIRFNAIGAVLPASLVPEGDAFLLRLRLDLCPSLPLELPARAGRRLDDGHVFVAFEPLGESVCASLERLVFRQHRRKVAVARQATS